MKVIDHKCPNCKSNLDYNPKLKNWICLNCNSIFNIDNLKKIEHNTKKVLTEYNCPNCNAKLITNSNIIATKCIYCQSSIIISSTEKNIKPDKLIPFSIDKDKAIEIFDNINMTKKLLPKEFNVSQNVTTITGVYIPFWLYSYKFKANINLTDFDNYIKKKYSEIEFNLIPFDANKHLDNKLTNSIEPFNYDELIDFNHSYLSGFIAQKYDIEEKEGLDITKQRAINTIQNTFRNKKVLQDANKINIITEELLEYQKYYTLLPIWLLNIKYKNKNYQIAINGQTGKLAGTLPIDTTKIKILALIIFIITFIIILLGCKILLQVGVL